MTMVPEDKRGEKVVLRPVVDTPAVIHRAESTTSKLSGLKSMGGFLKKYPQMIIGLAILILGPILLFKIFPDIGKSLKIPRLIIFMIWTILVSALFWDNFPKRKLVLWICALVMIFSFPNPLLDYWGAGPEQHRPSPRKTTRVKRPTSAVPQSIERLIRMSAHSVNLNETLLGAIAWVELDWKSKRMSRENGQGIMQLSPEIQSRYNLDDPLDPIQNIETAAHYFKDLLDEYGIRYALAAYYLGEATQGNVQSLQNTPWAEVVEDGKLPGKVIWYVSEVLEKEEDISQNGLPDLQDKYGSVSYHTNTRSPWITLPDGSLSVRLNRGQAAMKKFVLQKNEPTPWISVPSGYYDLVVRHDDSAILYQRKGCDPILEKPNESITLPVIYGSYQARVIGVKNSSIVKVMIVRS